MSFDGLLTCPTEEIISILEGKYKTICKIFAHYCKYSECRTIEMATRIRLGLSADAHRTPGTLHAAPRRAWVGLASPYASRANHPARPLAAAPRAYTWLGLT